MRVREASRSDKFYKNTGKQVHDIHLKTIDVYPK